MQPKNQFISLSISVSGDRYKDIIVPITAKDTLQRKVTCEVCHLRYAILGNSFFCPNCGNNSVDKTFDSAIQTIEDAIKNIPVIRKAIEQISKDEAATTCKSLIEKSLIDSVVAFQYFCELTYKKLPNAKAKLSLNAFQNLDAGNSLWLEVLGETYSNWFNGENLNRLNLLFQRRHLLQHRQGIVDEKYLEKTSDGDYKLGQRIIVTEGDVLELADLVKKVTDKIKQRVGELASTQHKI
jgi:hypothetical protein